MSSPIFVYPSDTENPRILIVCTDKVIFGNFEFQCPIGYKIEDATIFKPGYKGKERKNMTIKIRNIGTNKLTVKHVEI